MILVTGATGCLGSHLTKHLVERGERVAILRLAHDSRHNLRGVENEVEHRIGDVRDPDSLSRAFRGCGQLYHLAAIAAPISALRKQMFEINVEGTRNVLRAAKASGIERVVYTSSSAAIGIPHDGCIADESFPYNGDEYDFSYMHSKHKAEELVLQEAADGTDIVIVNPTAVMAPGGDMRTSWSGAISVLKEGRLPFYPSGGVAMVTRADMVDGHVKAMERGRTGQRYILNTVNITYRDMTSLIAQVVGARPPKLRAPDGLLTMIGRVNSFVNGLRRDPAVGTLLTSDNVTLLKRNVYYDQSKAVRELGLTQTPLGDAVRETAEWWETICRSNA